MDDIKYPRDNKHPRVLLVDDDEDLLAIIRVAANSAAFNLDTASEGEEALRLYQRAKQEGQPYAGLVLDSVMPGISGYAVATYIRERDSNLPLAFFTAHANGLWRHWAEELQVTAFWEKPVDPMQLVASIEAWLSELEKPSLASTQAG
jgi:CheY-like chemotaxis protein